MEFKLVEPTNLQLLQKILQKLQQKYQNHSNLQKNFYRALPDNGQIPFAIAISEGQIRAIYEVVKQLKFSRDLSTCYHTRQLLNQLKEDELNLFQKWMVTNLKGYKFVGLDITSNNVFKPHQVYMEAKNRPNL